MFEEPQNEEIQVRDSSEVLNGLLGPQGKKIIDIGCGGGRIARILAGHGATVIGIDPSDRQLDTARASDPAADKSFLKGVAENLPLEDRSADIVLFFNSFHHVPPEHMITALREASRVLKTAGCITVFEPLAEGPQFQLTLPIADETEIRILAYQALSKAQENGFLPVGEMTYMAATVRSSFEAFRASSIAINADRVSKFEKHDTELRSRFEELGEKVEGGYRFKQPMRVNIMVKP